MCEAGDATHDKTAGGVQGGVVRERERDGNNERERGWSGREGVSAVLEGSGRMAPLRR